MGAPVDDRHDQVSVSMELGGVGVVRLFLSYLCGFFLGLESDLQ